MRYSEMSLEELVNLKNDIRILMTSLTGRIYSKRAKENRKKRLNVN